MDGEIDGKFQFVMRTSLHRPFSRKSRYQIHHKALEFCGFRIMWMGDDCAIWLLVNPDNFTLLI